jgi:Ca-activated chloride channel family protein
MSSADESEPKKYADVFFFGLLAVVAGGVIGLLLYVRTLPYTDASEIEHAEVRYQKLIMPDRPAEPEKNRGIDHRARWPVSRQIAGNGLLRVLGSRRSQGKGALNDLFADAGVAGQLGDAFASSGGADVVGLGPAGGEFERRESTINAPRSAGDEHLSTFAVDVDTASYSIARRALENGRLPPPSLVRVEEFINYFPYDYDPPEGAGHPFSIQADGARSPVDSAKHILRVGIQAQAVEDADRMPANLVFLVDTSCSMAPQDRLPLAMKGLKIAVEHLSAKDKVAITTYAGGVRIVLPPTSADRRREIFEAIETLTYGGGTAMEAGLTLAYRQAARMLSDRSITRIIVCSDGDANIGANTPDVMLKQVAGYVSEGVTISTIGFGVGNYKDAMMEEIADRGNGNYYYVDTERMAERVFGRDLTKMLQHVAKDVKVQVDFDPSNVIEFRLVGYGNRALADRDFRNDKVDAGEIGAGHQVTALYELKLKAGAHGTLATVRTRAKRPHGTDASEISMRVPFALIDRAFESSPEDFRFATAVMGGAELLRQSAYADGWTYARVAAIVADAVLGRDPDRAEFLRLIKVADALAARTRVLSAR